MLLRRISLSPEEGAVRTVLTRKFAPAVALLTVALALIAATALMSACASSAPAGQSGTPPSENEATPTPTPEAAPELLEMSPKLQPLLYARFVQDAKKQSSKQGATGQSTPPETIEVHITTASTEQRPDVLRFLSDNGVTGATIGGNTFIIAQVPVSLLPRLVERSDVDYAKATSYPYGKLDTILNNDAARYETGLLPTAEEAVVWVSVHPKAGASFDETRRSFLNIRNLLKDNDAYFMTAPEDIDFMMNEIENKPAIRYDAIIPVSLLPTLAQHPDAGRFGYEGGLFPVSYLHRPTRERIQWHPMPSPESRWSDGPSGQSSSQRTAPSSTPSAAAAAHGADTWHDSKITGDGGPRPKWQSGITAT